ncbi:putative quinol monooxygenase [Aurantimonas sp. HBX-1]|uniref:putative quinol monooxygenase n=1 Tax=Aurantimonas sp. HBX-1 TaxID=2906072 RepID=UPI00351DA0A2
MSVAYVIAFQVRPGQQDRFLALLAGVLDAMRKETTYRGATLHVDPADPLHFLLH